jgi:hypothetical protein
MHFSEEQYKTIEEMAGLFFSPEDIADNLGLSGEDSETFQSMIELKSSDAYISYRRGRLRTEAEMRTAIKNAAMNGSSPAQNLMMTFYKESQ